MGLFDSFMGHASEVSAEKIQRELGEIMVGGESVEHAYAVFRDLFIFTNKRLVIVDKQGLTGSKQEIVSIPYSKISKFSIENAGTFDTDSELRLWIGNSPEPIKKELSRSIDIRGVYRTISQHVLK